MRKWILPVLGFTLVAVLLAFVLDDVRESAARITQLEQARDDAERDSEAIRRATDEAGECDGEVTPGMRYLCDQLAQIEDQPDPDDAEVQYSEIQEPEVQESERQNPESDDAETQDGETDDPETQDVEEQESEVQDPEVDDPDPDDPENQDPEVDDPDPNSALTFAIRDDCSPPAGEYVTDLGLSWERDGNTLTLVLTCTSAPAGPTSRWP